MKVTVVIENSVPAGAKGPFVGEHGLSLLLETGTQKILIDTGQSGAVVHNLSLLGVHSRELDAIAISHGHYDHTGGLPCLLRHRRKPVPVYAHSGIFKKRYAVANGRRSYAGLPFTKEETDMLGVDWIFADEPMEIAPKLWLSGGIPRVTGFEMGDAKLVIPDVQGCDCQDIVRDDTVLYYSGEQGLVVIGGCTHSGLVNAVTRGMELTEQTKLAGWIGGTHLGPVSQEQQELTLAMLEQYSPNFIAANHCTGFDMMAELKARFGKKFIPAFVSTVIEF
ncbi:MBL fold metallo-hydrolase [Acetonema longum]|uniref:Beta-lactamase domain protein n=1 Tax=Acetonema longum DSM 6540 TaxID=1009370 RepID=F7NNA0_9FIRM|nr:MBL fold metallo-hydrolase [Acetonema longum]EGO62485.1 beta-lactamase domain protein [Acetonema longum DSM 6540]